MLGCEMIVVQVGKGESLQTVHVHKAALLKSPFFRAFLTTEFAEAVHQYIVLPEDDFEAVKDYISWLYTGTFTYTAEHSSCMRTFWLFVDKVCDDDYCNDTIDALRASYRSRKLYMCLKSDHFFYNNGMGKTQIAKFGIKSNAYEMIANPEGWKESTTFYEVMKDKSEGLGEIMVDLVDEVMLLQARKGKLVSPAWLEGCQFHEHKDGRPCSQANETK